MNALLNSLTEAELMLVRETEPAQLAKLDEDGLVALHTRIRRARDKYTTSYRREASARVAEVGGRGKARPKNTRNREKAEVFEEALARVSRSLAAAARQSARELRTERIAAARAARGATPVDRPPTKTQGQAQAMRPQQPARAPASAPAMRKRQAATRAKGARRQAKRDSR
jgi:hypothetical protein